LFNLKEFDYKSIYFSLLSNFLFIFKTRKEKAPKYIVADEQDEDEEEESINNESETNYDDRRHSERRRVKTNRFS
jgi:hypothetical protein